MIQYLADPAVLEYLLTQNRGLPAAFNYLVTQFDTLVANVDTRPATSFLPDLQFSAE